MALKLQPVRILLSFQISSVSSRRLFSTLPRLKFSNKDFLTSNLFRQVSAIQKYSTVSMMNSKHLKAGSACPPLVDGKLRIYNMRFCPYAQRPLLVALAKNIPLDIVNCNLVEKPEFLLEKNPIGKVPVLEEKDGRILYESLIVSDYIDEVYPGKKLSASDPFQKAKDRIVVDRFQKTIGLFYKLLGIIRSGEVTEVSDKIEGLRDQMKWLNSELKDRGTTYFAGSEPGMLDYMIWPWMERIPLIKLNMPDAIDYEKAKQEIPTLEAWRHLMKEDPAVKGTICSLDVHQEFAMSFLTGSPNYDILSTASNM